VESGSAYHGSCLGCHICIYEAVDHIRDNVYTASNMAYVTDMHHGLNLTGIDNIRKIQYGKKHTKNLFGHQQKSSVYKESQSETCRRLSVLPSSKRGAKMLWWMVFAGSLQIFNRIIWFGRGRKTTQCRNSGDGGRRQA
jgi:hypothetical protein